MPAEWIWMQGGGALHPAGVIGRSLGLLAAYLALTWLQRYVFRTALLRSLGLPLNLLLLTLLGMVFLGPIVGRMNPAVGDSILAAMVFLSFAIGLKLVDVLFFETLARWRGKPQVPIVVRDLGRWGASTLVLVLLIRAFFPGVNLNVLAVSSLVVGYIVGNATQDTLGNLISGLALNTERPFQIGDWVTVGGQTGVVVDTTWRATRLRTRADDYIVIPNSSIAKESILNHSRPTRNHGCYLDVGVSYETPPNKVRRVILAVLAESPDVCSVPEPSVYLAGYGDSAITFKIKFFITEFNRLDAIQSGVMDRLWYAFRREGISIPYPIQDCRERDAVADEAAARRAAVESIRKLLAGVDVFQSLAASGFERLAATSKLMMFAQGEKLCRQGEAGDSFYIIRSGSVGVWVAGPDGNSLSVAHLGSGAFFGEMSLLTGEPRSATVTAETDVEVVCISKSDFAGLLQSDADLAGKLAATLETRLAGRTDKMAASAQSNVAPPTRSALLAGIRRFFGLAS